MCKVIWLSRGPAMVIYVFWAFLPHLSPITAWFAMGAPPDRK